MDMTTGLVTVKEPLFEADICLILEGTYPYVRGGVSSWVHQIISGLPELSFALLFIGDKSSNYKELSYTLPSNVIKLTAVFLVSDEDIPNPKQCPGNPDAYKTIRKLHKHFRDFNSPDLNTLLNDLMMHLHELHTLDFSSFLYSRESWTFITDNYDKFSSDASFLDYFWTIRAMHGPLFALIASLSTAPKARMYHSISTGYAGLYGVMLQTLYQRPYMLTEHGIYTKKRKIDLAQIDWINELDDVYGTSLDKDFSYLRQLWIRFFETIGRLTYQTAKPILAITEGNRQRQILDGAVANNVTVVPNGVDIKRFYALRERPPIPPPIIGFIGRVVPIKDVKTFIRAMRNICSQLPLAEAWIVGGEEEDPKYAQECRDLVSSLNLEDNIIYKGFCNINEVMADIGVIVLSSISEGLPLVILEAYASGLPVIATDVGACRELIEGGSPEDKAIGLSGAVVPIAAPKALAADEIVALLGNPQKWQSTREAAMRRVDTYFDQDFLYDNYRRLYQTSLAL
ncbi:MAG: GT4 family glycosyltransferase PelF [Methylococcales bacterium]|nr:GT4 family glycosyltransferase PelF [Methylococcales bacterium]